MPQQDPLQGLSVDQYIEAFGKLNQQATPEADAGIDEILGRTVTWWGDPELWEPRQRMERERQFQMAQRARPLVQQAWEANERIVLPDRMAWPVTKARSAGALAGGTDFDDLYALMRDAPVDTSYAWEVGSDGKRRMSQILPDGTIGFTTDEPHFADQSPLAKDTLDKPYLFGLMMDEAPVSEFIGSVVKGLPFQGSVRARDRYERDFLEATGHRRSYGLEEGLEVGDMLGARSAQLDSAAAFNNMALLYNPVKEEADGSLYVDQGRAIDPATGEIYEGGHLPLLNIRPGQSITIGNREVPFEEIVAESTRAVNGGYLGTDTLTGLLWYGKDDWMDTPFGRLLVPNLTGNKELDRELLKDAQFLRSMVEADRRYGDSFWMHVSQETLGIAEFVGFIKAAKFAGRFAKGTLAPLATPVVERLPFLGLLGRTGSAWKSAMAPSPGLSALGTTLNYNATMIPWMVGFESFKGAATQTGSPQEWVAGGVSGGLQLWGFGYATTLVGRFAGTFLGTTLHMGAKRSKLLAGVETRFKNLGPAGLEARQFQAAKDSLLNAQPKLRAIGDDAIRDLVREGLLGAETLGMNLGGLKATIHSFGVGYMMGSFAEAQREALFDGLDWGELSWDEQWGRWIDAVATGKGLASAIAFAGVTGSEHVGNRTLSRLRHGDSVTGLLSDGQKQRLKAMEERVLFNLGRIATNPEDMVNILDWANDPNVSGAEINRVLKVILGSDMMAPDIETTLESPSISELAELKGRQGGARILRNMMERMTLGELRMLEDQAAGARDGGDKQLFIDTKDVGQMAAAERKAREDGLVPEPLQPEVEKKKREKPEPLPEIPEDEVFEHFADEQSYHGQVQTRTLRLKDKPYSVIESQDPETGELVYVAIKGGKKHARLPVDEKLFIPKLYPHTEEGLREALGDVLSQARVRKKPKVFREMMKALKQSEKAAVRKAEEREELDEGETELLAHMRAKEAGRELQRLEFMRKVAAGAEEARVKEEVEQGEKPMPIHVEKALRRLAVEKYGFEPEEILNLTAVELRTEIRRRFQVGQRSQRKRARKKAARSEEREAQRRLDLEARSKEEPPLPERRETMMAQMDALRAGRKPAVLITPGERRPVPPKGHKAAQVPEGTLIYKDPAVLEQFLRGDTGLALGYGRSTRGLTDEVVTARDAKGRVVADIQSADTHRVRSAARELAGPGGRVEVRSVQDALNERVGVGPSRQAFEMLEPRRLPTVEEVVEAGQAIAAALEGKRGFGGASEAERIEAFLREQDLSSLEALQQRVREAQVERKDVVPRGTGARQTELPLQPREEDAALVEAELAEGGEVRAGRVERALAVARELAKQPQADDLFDAAAPSVFWDTPSKSSWLRRGHAFFGSQRNVGELTRAETIVAMETKKAEVAMLETELRAAAEEARPTIRARIQEESALLDSLVAGMVMQAASQRRGGSMRNVIAKVVGIEPGRVEGIRVALVQEGRRYDGHIERVLAASLHTDGKPLISPTVLRYGKNTPQGSDIHDLFRMIVLGPPVDLKYSKGEFFGGGSGKRSLAAALRKYVETPYRLTEEGADGEPIPARGVDGKVLPPGDPPVKMLGYKLIAIGHAAGEGQARAAKLLEAAAERIAKIPAARRDVQSLGHRVADKIVASRGTKAERQELTEEQRVQLVKEAEPIATQLVERLSGKQPGERAVSAAKFDAEKIDPEVLVDGATRRAVKTASLGSDLENLYEIYDLNAMHTVELLDLVAEVRLLDPETGAWEWALPREPGVNWRENPEGNSLRVASWLRRLASGDPAVRILFEQSKDEAGEPTFADPKGAWNEAQRLAAEITKDMQGLAVAVAHGEYTSAEGEQVMGIWEAMEHEAFGRDIPLDLRDDLKLSTELFPDGVIVDGHLADNAAHVVTQMVYGWMVQQGVNMGYSSKRTSEIVPFFAGVHPAMLNFTPVDLKPYRVETGSPGWFLGHRKLAGVTGKSRLRAIVDYLVEARGPFSGKDGKSTVFAVWVAEKLLNPWTRYIGRQLRSQLLPSKVAASNWINRRARSGPAAMQDRLIEEVQRFTKTVAEHVVSEKEANFLGKILQGGGMRRLTSRAKWEIAFGQGRGVLYDLLRTTTEAWERLAEWGVEHGAWSRETADQNYLRYFPIRFKLFADKGGIRARHAQGLSVLTDPGSARPREGLDVAADTANLIHDIRDVFPLSVFSEANYFKAWSSFHRSVRDGGTITLEEYTALPRAAQVFWEKIALPWHGKERMGEKNAFTPAEWKSPDLARMRRERVNGRVHQVKMHVFLEKARLNASSRAKAAGEDIPEARQKILDTMEEGYVTRATSLEFEILLDQMDPTMDTGGLSGFVQQVTLQWRRMKTIQNPKHWALNFITSLLTNHITDKVSLFDFLRSMMTGRGVYADALRDMMQWHEYVGQGRPDTSKLPAKRRASIERFDRIARELGGGTLVQAAFGRASVRDIFDTMWTPAARKLMVDRSSPMAELMSSMSETMMRRGRSMGRFDEMFAKMMGVHDPTKHAEALMGLNEVYYLHEMLFKYAGALNGMRSRNLSFKEAAAWGAEGSGDYLDRNPFIYRLTTTFSTGITKTHREALERSGKPARLAVRDMMIRTGVGSPFWMYRWSMWPTLARSWVDRPLRTAMAYGAMSFLIRAMSDDDTDLVDALSGRGDYLRSPLTPEVHRILKKKAGGMLTPSFTGALSPPWWREKFGQTLESWRHLATDPRALQGRGPGETVLDYSMLLAPGFGEASALARGVRDIFADHPPGDVKEINQLGVGFLPGVVAAAWMNTRDLFGVKGQTNLETRMKVTGRVLREAFSVAGPMPAFSSAGQEGILSFAFDGRSITDLARGTPPVTQDLATRVKGYAAGLVIPKRKISGQSAEPIDLPVIQEIAYKFGVRGREAPSTDEFERVGAELRRYTTSMIRRQMTNAYREFLQPDNYTPLQLIVNRKLDLGPDRTGPSGDRGLVSNPQTEFGAFIRRLSKDPAIRQRGVETWESILSARGEALKRVANTMASRRNVEPQIFERMVDGVLRGDTATAGLVDFLWTMTKPGREPWTADYDGEWARAWGDYALSSRGAELSPGSPGHAKWKAVKAWMKENSDSRYDDRIEVLHPSIIDAPVGTYADQLSPRNDFRMLVPR